MNELKHIFDLLGLPSHMAPVVSQTVLRLILAAVLGGMIGLERETKRKPAGLRTNMFICFGAAMFTIVSDRLATSFGGDHTRVAAQIVPGIGFIGAGSILHSRGSVTGLTTAATLFVVASIGMAAGGGMYVMAIFATFVILTALHILGWVEARYSLKPIFLTYQVVGESAGTLLDAINEVLAEEHHSMENVQLSSYEHGARVQFTVEATQRQHQQIREDLLRTPSIQDLSAFGAKERE